MPTVIICGTPGTGKSTLVERIKPDLPEANYINLSKFAIDNACTSGFDDQLECHIIDEEKLFDCIEPILSRHGLNVLESIHANLLDPEWVDKVFVLRTDTTKLYDRLQSRGYKQDKITNNVEAEIFQLIYDEAIESFGQESVIQLTNNEPEDLDRNVATVSDAIRELLDHKDT